MDEEKIQRERREQDENGARMRAGVLGFQYLDLRPIEQEMELIEDALSVQEMKKNYIIPLQRGSEYSPWQFGITTQTPQSFVREQEQRYHDQAMNIQFIMISNSAFRFMMTRYDPPVQVVYDDIKISKDGDSDTIAEVTETLRTVGSDEILDYLLIQADELGASDIHIENQRKNIRIRFRIDGVLHPVADLDKDRYRVIMGSLASRAGISTASTEPQSGHIQQEIEINGSTSLLNIRVESIPTLYGLDAVLRLFNFDQSMLNLNRLSLSPTELDNIKEIVSHPRGLALLVGPTGSGKSTTLYSILNELNNTSRKIITLEDPVEFGIDGISQIPIDSTNKQNFATGLRSILRLDPDVVMVGEIRDADTARTAIQASITGHLVLSSFHANSASAAFSRMIDLIGVNPIFSSAVRMVIAQRLVRRLDDSSKEEYTPDEATVKWVKEVLSDLPEEVEKPDLDNFKLWKPVSTSDSPFGYNGRIVLMEQLMMSEELQKYIRGDITETNTETIEATAKAQGMVTLLQAGVLAALDGRTTLEEVNRAI
ncbi:type II/IV secretion system protein [Candidatus Saccharibacteria bacterium]|nr:type II/IV secretion system protein [Candidatus Saccharibacteria bacterium]